MGGALQGISLLDQALPICQELNMRPLLERVVALQEQVASLLARALAYPNGLTEREVAVLRLIASGKSNNEIADELYISGLFLRIPDTRLALA